MRRLDRVGSPDNYMSDFAVTGVRQYHSENLPLYLVQDIRLLDGESWVPNRGSILQQRLHKSTIAPHQIVELNTRALRDSDKTRQDKTRQDETRRDETRRDETRQDETRQDKTRHDET